MKKLSSKRIRIIKGATAITLILVTVILLYNTYYLPEKLYSKGNELMSLNVSVEEAKKIIKYYTKAAQKGHVTAQQQLGVLYSGVDNFPENKQISLYWTFKAAKNGSKTAQIKLSKYYAHGNLVPKLELESIYWLEKAARGNSPEAQLTLSKKLQDGFLGQRPDSEKAKFWLSKALENSFETKNDYILYDISKEFEGQKEIDILEQSALLGNYYSQISLVEKYAQGINTDQNLIAAWAWYNIANVNDQAYVDEETKVLINSLSDTEMEQAKKLAHNFWNEIKRNKFKQ